MKLDSDHRHPSATKLLDADQVSAHLVFLAVEVQQVTLDCEARSVQGRVQMPTADGHVPFVPDGQYGGHLERPLTGMPARLDYEVKGTSYSFTSPVAGVDPTGRWLVHPPGSIVCSDRRLVLRHATLGDPGFSLQLDGPWQPGGFRTFPLLDISTDGMGFLFHQHRTPLHEGDLLGGRLIFPACQQALCTVLRVANVRPFRPGSARMAAGARFVDLSLDDRMALARSVRTWETHRQVA